MPPGPRQLTSWKELAHYLGVNVRTAQKWERERGLPVHRAAGARSRVSADTASLDAWKQQVAHVVSHEDRSYRWPLGPGLTVEVRFLGADLGPVHIDLLREYLDLFKTALR
jgi:excisionase family DNA binding protein